MSTAQWNTSNRYTLGKQEKESEQSKIKIIVKENRSNIIRSNILPAKYQYLANLTLA